MSGGSQSIESLFPSLVAAAPFGMAVVNQDFFIVFVNDAFERIVHRPKKQLLEMSLLDMVAEHRLEESRIAFQIARKSRRFRGVIPFVLPYPRPTILAEITLSRMESPSLPADEEYYFVSINDVTVRENNLREVVRNLERYELASLGANDGFWDWNSSEPNKVFVSRRIEQMAGGRHLTSNYSLNDWLSHVFAEDKQRLLEAIDRVRRREIKTLRVEIRFEHANQSIRWLLIRAVPTRDINKRLTRLTGSVADITNSRKLEEASRNYESMLAHLLRLQLTDNLAAGISHELNQPLSSIANYANGCLRRLNAGMFDPVPFAEALERIVASALLAGDILNHVRGFIKKREPIRQKLDSVSLTQSVVALLDYDFATQGIHVSLEFDDKLQPIFADKTQVEQVLINLIRNAIDSMKNVSVDDRQLKVCVRNAGKGVAEFTVADTGPGIKEGQKIQLFEPFVTTKESGLGMGLAICRSIVESHGGRIGVENNPAGGASFYFTIPSYLDDELLEGDSSSSAKPATTASEATGPSSPMLDSTKLANPILPKIAGEGSGDSN